jgi:DNA-binding winged helix-turn-helix (wHTH) protein/pimeloyl-ACP methyl ester carboxylesterase
MIYRFGRFELDEERRELRDGSKVISVQPLTFDALALLARNHARVVSKQEFLDALWPGGFVAEGSLQRVISLARTAIKDEQHEIIRTFSGRGYRLSAQVTEVGAKESPGLGELGQSDAEPPEAPAMVQRFNEPRIRYARTSDGVSIAYWTLGKGPPLVVMSDAPSSHVRLEWHIPELRSWYERLARNHTIVRFDQRGTGLSDRDVDEFSLRSFGLDLQAVVDALAWQRFALFSYVDSGPVAIAFAARNPKRLSHLILWSTYSRGREYTELPQIRAVRALMDKDYNLYTETLAHLCLGWVGGEPIRRWAQLMRECVSQQTLATIYSAVQNYDVVDDLARVAVPTLVMHPAGLDWFPETASTKIAAGIPNSRLALLQGASEIPFVGGTEAALEIIDDFLNETPQAP